MDIISVLRRKLTLKLIVTIAGILFLTIGFFSYITITIQKKYLIGEMEQYGGQLSQTISSSIKNDMMLARSDHIQQTLEDIGKQEGIEHIRLFDKMGKIIASDSKGDLGIIIDSQEEACIVCHNTSEPLKKLLSPVKTRIFQSTENGRSLGIINPIYNESMCSTAECHYHPEDQNVLGVMEILLPLKRFDEQILRSRSQILVYFFITLIVISVGITLLIFSFVNKPIGKLMEGTRRISSGDLTYRIGDYHSDEIGELGKSFDMMTAELLKSREEIEQWNLKLKREIEKATENTKKTNKKLNIANKKLRELDYLKSDFMRRMEHGSRSHLAVIKSCLSLVLSHPDSGLTFQHRDLIDTAERRCSTMLELLDDILLLSYRKSFDAVYQMEPVQLTSIVLTLLDGIENHARRKNISIDVSIPNDLPAITADKDALKELFFNLINNAVKYTMDGGEVKISIRLDGLWIKIDVSDTGIGISTEDLPKIFDEFFRSSNAKSRNIEGTGVGLAIVNEVVDAHKGKLEVQSELGKGTTFTVKLPLIESLRIP
ncbi:ATP-binding protein [Acidobacteriota bacterium]